MSAQPLPVPGEDLPGDELDTATPATTDTLEAAAKEDAVPLPHGVDPDMLACRTAIIEALRQAPTHELTGPDLYDRLRGSFDRDLVLASLKEMILPGRFGKPGPLEVHTGKSGKVFAFRTQPEKVTTGEALHISAVEVDPDGVLDSILSRIQQRTGKPITRLPRK